MKFCVCVVLFLSLGLQCHSQLKLLCSIQAYNDISDDEINSMDFDYMMMTISERVLLLRYMLNSTVYFEYGSGASSLLACSTSNIRQLTVVDSDRALLQRLIDGSQCLSEGITSGRVVAEAVDIGPVTIFGYPVDDMTRSQWNYYPDSIVHSLGMPPDLVLVDGRFRVASVLYSVLASSPNTIILVHDFYSRDFYYRILDYVDVVDCVGDLIAVRKKRFFDSMALILDIIKYKDESD